MGIGRLAGALVLLALSACLMPWEGAPRRNAVDRTDHDMFPIFKGQHRVECNVCHGDSDTFSDFTCIPCHEHTQPVMDPPHTLVSTYAFGPETCYSCHPTGEQVGRGEHTSQYFPISAGNHARVACTGCHLTNTDSYDCVLCHDHTCAEVDRTHQGRVSNYQCTSTACRSCHPTGEPISRDQHTARYFPISTGDHGAINCRDCHCEDSYAKFECIHCHAHTCDKMDPIHRHMHGYQCNSVACRACHPTGGVGGMGP